jgi:hypothetical protein
MMDYRAKYRVGLSTLYLPFYDALCKALAPEWAPYDSIRTFDQQTALWNQGRTTPGGIVTNAKAGESAHNYACATDWTIWSPTGQPIWMPKDDPRWQIYVDAVRSVGLRAGVDFGDVDHNELKIDCDWPHVLIAFNIGGMTAAQQKIQESMCA